MSVPNSILWVLLVVVWLFVLVPIVVNRRPKVMTVSQAALSTRVLFQGGYTKLKHRIRPHAGQTAGRDHEDTETAHDKNVVRRPASEVFSAEHDEDLEVINETEWVLDDEELHGGRSRRPAAETVEDAEVVAVGYVEMAASRPPYVDEDREERAAASARAAALEEQDEEEVQNLARRIGRGGFNPSADASARAQRYAVRQRIVLGLLISLIATGALGLAITPVIWYATGALALCLGGYLSYLRRQVRIEERISARRMARFSRGHRSSLADQDEEPARRRQSAQRPQAKAHAPRVVAVDEDDPDFADLPSPHEGRLRRASGE